MLKIKNISVNSENHPLLKEINLDINASEIHAVIGPERSGKSALAHIITGHPGLEIADGTIYLNDQNLLELETHERIQQGIFVGFQVPLEFDNVTSWELAQLMFAGEDLVKLREKFNQYAVLLGLNYDHGEQKLTGSSMTVSQAKRNDLIYMLMSNPQLIVLDDIDSELEEHEIVLVASMLKDFLKSDQNRACLIISSSKTLLDILKPTQVHVLVAGEIKMSGNEELYKRIVEDGYSEFS